MRRWLFALLLLLPVSAVAQPVNPKILDFEHSAEDMALTTSYEIRYYASQTAATPVSATPVAKPAQTACNPCVFPLPPLPATNGTYYASLSAVYSAGRVESVRVPFVVSVVVAPRAPVAVTVRP